MDISITLVEKFKIAEQKKTTINDFVQDFLGQFISKQTKIAYVKDLVDFFNFLKSGNVVITAPSDIQAFHFRLYRDSLLERQLASATINRRLVCIRSFIKWAIASNLMTHNPLDTIKLPKVQTESPTVAFDDSEVTQMLQTPDISTHSGRTVKIVLVILFNLGLRRSELTSIKFGDFYEERGHRILKVIGKGNKIRLIPINDDVWGEITSYSNTLNLLDKDYLIQTEENTRNIKSIDGSTIYRMLQRTAEKCGITKDVSPHSCRATVISHLLDTQKVAIRDVADFVGHSNITTTESYDKRRSVLNNSAAYQVKY